MNNLLRFLVGIRVFLLFLFLEIIAITLMVTHSYYQQSVIINNLHTARGVMQAHATNFIEYLSLREVNTILSEENTRLRNELSYHQSDKDTTRGTVYDSLKMPLYTYISANIIDNSVNKQHNFIILDAGKDRGVEPDMGVITENGVVGVITAVDEHFSFVKSILNTGWKFNVRLKQSGDFGPLQWDGLYYNQSVLSDIPQHSKINAGDTVVTSGYSELFPQNIPIGVVHSYEIKRSNFYEIRVDLFADLKKIQHVNIVTFLYRDELKSLKKLENE